MSDQPDPMESFPAEEFTPGAEVRKTKDPAATLNSALVVYVFVNMAFALPLVIFPTTYFDGNTGHDCITARA